MPLVKYEDGPDSVHLALSNDTAPIVVRGEPVVVPAKDAKNLLASGWDLVEGAADDIKKLTKDALQKFAHTAGIFHPDGATKADILQAIEDFGVEAAKAAADAAVAVLEQTPEGQLVKEVVDGAEEVCDGEQGAQEPATPDNDDQAPAA